MTGRILLISIRPEYADKIFDGIKYVELRRTRPRVEEGDLVVVYASSPRKALIGLFEVKKVVKKPLKELWHEVKEKAGITYNEFRTYYKGTSVGCGIFLDKKYSFSQPIKLEQLREEWDDFRPPQSYRYLKPGEVNLVENITKFDIAQVSRYHQTSLENIL